MRSTLDPATRTLLGDRRRRVPAAVLALTLAALAALVTLGLVLRAAWPDGEGAADPPAAAPSPSVPAPAPASANGPVVLPQPTGTVDGVALGFPASPAGAVAAAYAYTRIASSLDAAATLRALEQIADPASGWLTAQRTEIADGITAQRKGLGLGAVGPSDGATLTITPAGFQFVGRPESYSAQVLTLAVVSGTAVDGTRTSGSVVLRWDLRWDGERWRVMRSHVTDRYDDLVAVPLTSDAVGKGWREARGG